MILKKKSSPASKLLLSFGLIFVSSAYAAWQHIRHEVLTSTPTTLMSPMMNGRMMNGFRKMYADGSYIGTSFDAYYGIVQVKAVVTNGKITDVQFLQYPNSRSNSRMINNQAMPMLAQEAIQAQSAKVNGVSGATFTSDAFQQSLASALALAKN